MIKSDGKYLYFFPPRDYLLSKYLCFIYFENKFHLVGLKDFIWIVFPQAL